jgi:hypothetical protein
MKIINLLINEDVLKAEIALEHAASDDLIDACRAYLRSLSQYRDQLHQLGGIPETNLTTQSKLGRELIEQSRKAVRAAVEATVNECNRAESLLESITLISAWDAAETFNRLRYKNSDKWEMSEGRVRISGNGEQMSVTDAVETAGRLRRDAFAADKTTFFRK